MGTYSTAVYLAGVVKNAAPNCALNRVPSQDNEDDEDEDGENEEPGTRQLAQVRAADPAFPLTILEGP